MTASANINAIVGFQPVGNFATAVEVATAAFGTYVPQTYLGSLLQIVDPYLGGGEVIRLRVPAGTAAIPVGGMAVYSNTYVYTIAPNTANLGQPLAFAVNAIPLNASFDQYAWFYVGGSFPAFSNATVAANTTAGIVAAGQAGAQSAGKEIMNARVQLAATNTVVKNNCNLLNGSVFIRVPNSDGWFAGLYLSGTGIQAGTTIVAIDSATAGSTVTLSLAATISGPSSVTGTYNNGTIFWNVLNASRPGAQGAIT